MILTVVDIRAVGPGVWNGWKGQLLRTLFAETEPHLYRRPYLDFAGGRIEAAKQAFADAIDRLGQPDNRRYLKRHYDAYWYTVDLEHQVHGRRLLDRAGQASEPCL